MGLITAKIIAHSISRDGVELVTFELEYPRYIHSELMTHRVFSRNTASSRAVPVERTIQYIKENTAIPVYWGVNKSGMSSEYHLDGEHADNATKLWLEWRDMAIRYAETLGDKEGLNVHKQWTNRGLEPWSMHKAIVTSTEWDNFFDLRNHPDAQPDIQELAKIMNRTLNESVPKSVGWHLPYIEQGGGEYWTNTENAGKGNILEVSLEDAIKISVSCCAQVSYRRLDQSLEKARRIYDQMANARPMHASPFEHQAKDILLPSDIEEVIPKNLPKGVTSVDRYGNWWSGNLRGWVQYRNLI